MYELRPALYCAGKISAGDWRNQIFGTRNMNCETPPRGWNIDRGRPRFVGMGDGGNHPDWRYAGPFFIGCDHSCAHGVANHGCAANEPQEDPLLFGGLGCDGGCIACGEGAPSRPEVLNASLACIRAADLIFVWIDLDFLTAHGTITEIGYAAALEKPIFTARSPQAATTNLIEAWFPLSLTKFLGTHASVAEALSCVRCAYRSLGRALKPKESAALSVVRG